MPVHEQPSGAPIRQRNVLDRPRLLAQLESPAALVVLRGGRGSGKSTALAGWLRSRQPEANVLWLSLDEEQATVAAVWAALMAALWHSTQTEIDGADSAPPTAENLARRLRESGRPFVLALDHGELLGADAVETIVQLLAGTAALTIGVAVGSRGPFESMPVRMSVDTLVLDEAELEFTAEETAAVLGAAELPSDTATVRFVRAAAGGHPLATRAALIALAGAYRPSLDDLRRHIAQSLGWGEEQQNALAQEHPLVFEFCVRSSVLGEVPVGFADVLVSELWNEFGGKDSGIRSAPALLDRVEQMELGSYPHGANGRVFRLVTVARQAFRAELEARPGAGTAAKRFAGQWLVGNDKLEDGFFLAVESGDYDTATFAATRRFTHLLSSRVADVRAALAPVSLATMQRHPLLALTLALSYNQVFRLRLRAIEYFEVAVSGATSARANMDAPGCVVLDTVLSGALRITGRSESAGQAARRALSGLAALSERERQELGSIVDAVAVQSGLSLLKAGDLDGAFAAFRQSSAPEDSRHSAHALAALAGTHALVGEMREAAGLVAEGQGHEWPVGWIGGYQGSLFALAQALLALESWDFDAAQAAVDSIDQNSSDMEHWPAFADAQARIDLFADRADAGSHRLRLLRQRKRGRADLDAASRRRLDIVASLLHLSTGRVRQAEAVLAAIPTRDTETRLALARVQLVRDAPDAALTLLLDGAHPLATERLRAEHLAVECAVMLRLGQREAGAAGLERLAAALDFADLLTPLALIPKEDLDDLRELAAERCSADVVRVLGQAIPAVLHRAPGIVLSDREHIVLRALVRTSSVSAIADELFVSANTVKSQLRSLYRKFGVKSREGALVFAVAQHLFESPPPDAR